MHRSMTHRLGLSLLLTLVVIGAGLGQDVLKGRARWEWVVTNSNGKQTRGTFMGYVNGEIKHGKKQELVGSWKAVGADRIEATFDKGPLTGLVSVKRSRGTVPTYVGELTPKNGSKKKIVIELYKD